MIPLAFMYKILYCTPESSQADVLRDPILTERVLATNALILAYLGDRLCSRGSNVERDDVFTIPEIKIVFTPDRR